MEDRKDYILSAQQSLCGKPDIIGFGNKHFYIKEISRDTANAVILKNHYSHKYYSASYIHLGVFMDGAFVGVLQFGYAMNPASQASVVAETLIDEYLELNRMWLDDVAPKNSETMAISYCIKYIKGRFKKIKWIQSFADERCKKFGVVYQAANFKYFGEHKAIFWTLDGIVYHNIIMTAKGRAKGGDAGVFLQANKHRATKEVLRQFRYLYFIDKKMESKALLKENIAPKHYDDKK